MRQQGFTLIELMITVAIIGILSAVAIAFYNDYTVRVRVVTGISTISSIQVGVTDAYFSDGLNGIDLYAANVQTNLAAGNIATSIVESVAVSTTPGEYGVIRITYRPSGIPALGTNNTLSLNPHISGAALDNALATSATLQWECAGATGSISTANFPGSPSGTIASRYLPNSCR